MNSMACNWFPLGNQLREILCLETSAELDDLFLKSLHQPLDDLLKRPGKNLRSELVRLGFRVGARISRNSSQPTATLQKACDIIELIHIGSLVVDDIEDGSLLRRGGPALHSIYGLSVALNAGNWLYFLPFQHIENMDISVECRGILSRECHRMLLRAHYGQALDVGVAIRSLPQQRVYSVIMSAIELKSGALMGFAIKFGAIIGGAEPSLCQKLEELGRRLGVALQMFDDLGNLNSSSNPHKKLEDLKLKRMSYVLAVAASNLSDPDYQKIMEHVEALPENTNDLCEFMSEKHIVSIARSEACDWLQGVFHQFQKEFHLKSEELSILTGIKERLEGCYG